MDGRQGRMIEHLQNRGGATIDELCSLLHYSRSTVRRDLLRLEQMGVLLRSKGRVSLVVSGARQTHYRIRQLENVEAKEYIAKKAAGFLFDGASLFLDASTTAGHITGQLADYKNLTVITNGIETALKVSDLPVEDLFVAGGYTRQGTCALLGEPAVEFVRRFEADLCLVSCCGMDQNAVYEASMQMAYVKRAMLEHSRTKILLCDSSKFGLVFKYRLGEFSDFNYIVTEKEPPQEILAVLKGQCDIIW